MAHIVGISGSLRKGSFNTALLHAAASATPAGSTIDIRSIAGIPLYDGDVEARDGIPTEVAALKDAIAGADGLLIVTPEYNNSIPGVLKNAIDWLSRPAGRYQARVWRKTGRDRRRDARARRHEARAGRLAPRASNAWHRTLVWRWPPRGPRRQGVRPEGRLVDDAIRSRLETFIKGFVEFAGSHAPAEGVTSYRTSVSSSIFREPRSAFEIGQLPFRFASRPRRTAPSRSPAGPPRRPSASTTSP